MLALGWRRLPRLSRWLSTESGASVVSELPVLPACSSSGEEAMAEMTPITTRTPRAIAHHRRHQGFLCLAAAFDVGSNKVGWAVPGIDCGGSVGVLGGGGKLGVAR